METVYYHLNARKVGVERLASGAEAAGAAVRYALLPTRREQPRSRQGNVLDLEAYRRRLEGAQDLPPEAEEPVTRPGEARGAVAARWVSLALEAAATVAVIVFAAVASIQFLQLL